MVQRPLKRELYKDRNKVERFFNRVKHYRRIATRYEKTTSEYMAMLHLVSVMVQLISVKRTFHLLLPHKTLPDEELTRLEI
jgi:transposase